MRNLMRVINETQDASCPWPYLSGGAFVFLEKSRPPLNTQGGLEVGAFWGTSKLQWQILFQGLKNA